MRSIFIGIIGFFFSFSVWSAEAPDHDKRAISFNYLLNLTNPAGDIPVTVINFSVSPSLIRNDIHEFGAALSYSVNKTENTITNTTSESSTTSITGFYRYITPMGDPNSKYPLSRYFGPQIGFSSGKQGTDSSSSVSYGGQFGINMMVSQNMAINFHLIQVDYVASSPKQLLVTQSIGVKYYF